MISLVLRSKLAVTEDVLTAAVFDFIRRSPSRAVLIKQFLSSSRATGSGGGVPIPDFESVTVELWPALSVGEPDVRVVLHHSAGRGARILFEAKLGASKSGEGPVSIADGSGDQLAKYLLAESDEFPNQDVFLVYLTHHAGFPMADIMGSGRALELFGRADLAGRLRWLSWRDVMGLLDGDEAAVDVLEVLRRAKMFRFSGMKLETFPVAAPLPLFYGGVDRKKSRSATIEYPGAAAAHGRLLLDESARWSYRRSARRYSWRFMPPCAATPEFYEENIE